MDKPDGYDFRDKRSDKTRDAKDWHGVDALYAATLEVPKDTVYLVVMWMDADGVMRHRKAGSSAVGAWMAAKFLQHCV